jgi:hypothetical protein
MSSGMLARMLKERPALTVKQWLASVPAERKDAIRRVRDVVNARLPEGYEETVDWGMLAWVVPLATLPGTHNGRPLLYAALGAHRKRMTVYLPSVFGDPKMRSAFQTAYAKTGKKLDMGGSCVHFGALDDLPLDVVGDTVARVGVAEYVARYEASRTKKPKPKTTAIKKPAKKTAKR